MLKLTTSMISLLLATTIIAATTTAFAPTTQLQNAAATIQSTQLFAKVEKNGNGSGSSMMLNRRNVFSQTTKLVTGIVLTTIGTSTTPLSPPAFAAASSKVVVAGATGQTGRRILERLAQSGDLDVIGGVRNVPKATDSLNESSTVVRGAMVQKVSSVDTSAVNLKKLDVVMDSVDDLAKGMEDASALVIATGFVPGNPLKMNAAAHDVDNVGTIKLIDAAKKIGVKKIVMVSSILTNGRNWGQEKSAGFIITNAFGNVLDEKLVAENYLKSSGIDYTIVRPGGLKAKPPTGALQISGEDTLNSGEISRDLVADVCVASLTDSKASNKVLEIIEDEGTPPQVFNGLKM